MGAQSQLLGVGSTIAGAALAAAKVVGEENKKEQAQEQGLLAKEQFHEAKADVTKLQGESEEASKALQVANENVEATKG